MRLVAVTACPTGIAHCLMASEALKRQAVQLGHTIAVETQGADGTKNRLAPDEIAAADAVIVAADIFIDPERFKGKPIHAVTTAEAIRKTYGVIQGAVAEAEEPEPAEPEPTPYRAEPPVRQQRLVGITSCPTGIAHTFMAAEGLRKAAEEMGHWIKVETQGSVGAKNVLTPEEVAEADAVIIAADTKVDLSRFAGKRVYETGTKEALKHGGDVVTKALTSATVLSGDGALPPPGADGRGGGDEEPGHRPSASGALKGIYQNLMTGVSYMLPFVVAGGLLIALAFAFDIHANDPANATTFAGRLYLIGSAGLTLFVPVLGGFIAYAIADRPGLAPGFIGGYLASQVGAGFLGALLAGFAAGYLTKFLAEYIRLPPTLAGLKPVLILPLLSTLGVGLLMYYVIGEPVKWVIDHLTDWLDGLQGSNAAILGLLLGGMMAIDMGGPLNKVAYTFAVGLIDSGVTEPMAAVMAAGMTPPLALALATVLFRDRWLPEEHEAGKPAWVLGASFITEGAIPFAARDPIRVIPALVAGSAAAGAMSLGFGASTVVPHGGIFDLFVPGAVEKPMLWLLSIVVGTLVSTAVLFFTKRPIVEEVRAPALVGATAATAAT